MSIKQLLYFLTIAVATVSSHLTQVSAQSPIPNDVEVCEEFIANFEANESTELVFLTFSEQFPIFPASVFEPDSELGDVCGVCFSAFFSNGSSTNFANEQLEIFDGDTSLGIVIPSEDPSFIAGPGQKITRIERRILFGQVNLVTDMVLAVKPAPVVEEDVSSQQCLANIAVEIGDLADAATDSEDAYALNVACAALNFAARDDFFEEDGNRLTRYGSSVFTGAAYAISFLEYADVEGTEDIVDRILDKLEQIVDDEIDYALANGGTPKFIERAEDLAEVAQWIDEDLDNPVIATFVYKLAWVKAFFATY